MYPWPVVCVVSKGKQRQTANHEELTQGFAAQDLLRKLETADDTKNTFSLTVPEFSGDRWPSKDELLYAIMAMDDNSDAQPYPVNYPGPNDPLECPGKYCGWNHQSIKQNKGSFFYVIDDLNRTGSFDNRRVAEWEKQLLFSIAMQVRIYRQPCTRL